MKAEDKIKILELEREILQLKKELADRPIIQVLPSPIYPMQPYYPQWPTPWDGTIYCNPNTLYC